MEWEEGEEGEEWEGRMGRRGRSGRGGGGGGGGIHFPSANWNICTRKQQDTFPIPLHTTFLHEIKCEEKKTVEKGYKNTF